MSQGQPTQEELRAYLEQLREADVTEVILQAYSVLGTGAEVKLGRPDARLAIDALAGLVNAVAGKIDPQLHERLRQGVTQLQMAQVQLESGEESRAEGGAAEAAAGETGEQPSAPQQRGPSQGGQQLTDRLWVPGRDPQPPR